MRHIHAITTTFVLVGGLTGSSVVFAIGAGDVAGTQASQQTPASWARTHAVRGVVKSTDATSLVVTRARRNTNDLTFALTPSTLREGSITVGSTVSVRYRTEGDTLVATAVVARTLPDAYGK